jgi:hypothetical protein
MELNLIVKTIRHALTEAPYTQQQTTKNLRSGKNTRQLRIPWEKNTRQLRNPLGKKPRQLRRFTGRKTRQQRNIVDFRQHIPKHEHTALVSSLDS